MKPRSSFTAAEQAVRDTAAHWTVRRDRGLSAAEAIEFELWLAADPRHAAAMRRAGGAWSLLDRMPDATAERALAAAARRRGWWRRVAVLGSLAAAAALTIVALDAWRDAAPPAAPAALVAAGPRSVTLADGSLVRLNAGGEVVEQFTAAERRVVLTRGEAHFTVTKNPARPFVVLAGALRVQAVGTAFNVNLQSAQIEVLVTEGRVQLAAGGGAPAAAPLVAAGERAVFATDAAARSVTAPAIVVTRVDAAAMARALAWHDSLLRLGGATLAELAREFEQHSGQRVQIVDPEVAQLRFGGRFRADDADGFAHLLATTFDVDVERGADGAWLLRKKKMESR